jgi:PDZ domain-containing secreted protein
MKKYKRVIIIIFTFLLFVFSLYYLITGPTIKKYTFKTEVLSEVSKVSSENLKNYVKYLSENDRTFLQ